MQISGVFGLAGVQKGTLMRAYSGCYNVRWPAGSTFIPPFKSPARKIRQRKDGTFTESRSIFGNDEVASIRPLYTLLAEQQKHMHAQQMDTQRRLHEMSRDQIGMMKEMMAYFDRSMRSMMETMGMVVSENAVNTLGQKLDQHEKILNKDHAPVQAPAQTFVQEPPRKPPFTPVLTPVSAEKHPHGQVISMPSMGPEDFAEINFSKYVKRRPDYNPPIIVATDKKTGKIVRISG